MNKYNFYYDESEHSRKINYNTITADNYYDSFIAVVVGWNSENEADLYRRYAVFEEKYTNRWSKGELKSTTIKQGQFKSGFASLNNDNICLLDDFLTVFSEKTLIYFSVISKVEYLVMQLFENYQNSNYVDTDALIYSITKALLIYRPKQIIEGIFDNTDELVSLLKAFFRDKIRQNKSNVELKQKENRTFGQILVLLNGIGTVKTIDWNYDTPFIGFRKFLREIAIDEYSLIIDKEGENKNTLKAAQRVGLCAVEEVSNKFIGIRMADMLAGLISKLLKALYNALCYSLPVEQVSKKILDKSWFKINERQLNLYKKMYKVIVGLNNTWYKSYTGIYCDDLIVLVAFLEFMNHFESIQEIKDTDLEMQGEYFNAHTCDCLTDYYERM